MASYLNTHRLIVGASGAGKTVTAKVEVEALLEDGRHLCIIDPTGAWHGLRTSADGERPGFAIPIFGGQHGDVPITAEQGGDVGSIIGGGVSAIIDLADMDSDEQQSFVWHLIAALRKTVQGHFQFVVDEADEFAPQTSPSTAGEAAKRQMEWIAKRGRVQGFVLTAITQRPADIAKSVISQMQTVVAHQLIAPADQKALEAYLKANAPKDTIKTVMESLAGLDRGERWIYSPRLGILERGLSPMPGTFDSSRTPEPGESVRQPKMLAQIDLGAIREALAPKAEEQLSEPSGKSADDAEVKRLRARVAELEAERDNWTIESAYGQQQLDALIAERDELRRLIAGFVADTERVRVALADEQVSEAVAAMPAPKRKPQPSGSNGAAKGVTAGETAKAPAPSGIPASQQRVLDAIAWWSAVGISPVERNRASVIAGLSPKASTFGVYVSKLAQAGLVDTSQPGTVGLTEAGRSAANSPGRVNRREVVVQARLMLKPAAANVFDEIVSRYPEWVDRGELADIVGLSRTASTLGVYISESSKLGFVETKPGKVRAAEWMMP